MRAFQLSAPGGIEALRLTELPTPKPGRSQVLVKIAAASLNARDLAIVQGRYRMHVKPNLMPLSDGAGEVVAVGEGVTRVKVGDRVAGCFFQNWIGGEAPANTADAALGGSLDGMLAEYAVLEQTGVVRLPEHLSYEEGATLPCAALTAWRAIFDHAHLKPGQTILVQGTGGVSIFALQFARMIGARAIAISSSDDKLARVRELGAVHGINYKQTPEWDVAVQELTGGRGVDHVVEVGGPGTLTRSLKAIRAGGYITVIGVLSGTAEINPTLILWKRASLQGISVGSTEMFEAMNAAIAANRLQPVIDRIFPFADAPAAFRHLQSGAHFGKIVIGVG